MNKKAGVDVISNGEIDRENYIHFFMRNWEGVDFENQEEKSLRDDAYKAYLPVIRGKVTIKKPSSAENWLFSTEKIKELRPFTKYTIPGP